jgi:hypothetical protein
MKLGFKRKVEEKQKIVSKKDITNPPLLSYH